MNYEFVLSVILRLALDDNGECVSERQYVSLLKTENAENGQRCGCLRRYSPVLMYRWRCTSCLGSSSP